MRVARRSETGTALVDRAIEKGGHLESVGVNIMEPNVSVAVGIDSDRFLSFLVSRLQGK